MLRGKFWSFVLVLMWWAGLLNAVTAFGSGAECAAWLTFSNTVLILQELRERDA